MTQLNIAEAKAHFSEIIQRAMLGEEIIIEKGVRLDKLTSSSRSAILFVSRKKDVNSVKPDPVHLVEG